MLLVWIFHKIWATTNSIVILQITIILIQDKLAYAYLLTFPDCCHDCTPSMKIISLCNVSTDANSECSRKVACRFYSCPLRVFMQNSLQWWSSGRCHWPPLLTATTYYRQYHYLGNLYVQTRGHTRVCWRAWGASLWKWACPTSCPGLLLVKVLSTPLKWFD